MRRRQFFGLVTGGAGAALLAPRLAFRADAFELAARPLTISETLQRLAAGAAATLDRALNLRPVVTTHATDHATGVSMRLLDPPPRHWGEAAFYLTDRELAEGATDAPSYRESVKALVYEAQRRGINFLHSTACGVPGLWVEARYGCAIARADVSRMYKRERWTISWLGGYA